VSFREQAFFVAKGDHALLWTQRFEAFFVDQVFAISTNIVFMRVGDQTYTNTGNACCTKQSKQGKRAILLIWALLSTLVSAGFAESTTAALAEKQSTSVLVSSAQHVAETTTPVVARQFQLTPVATLEVAISARQVKFGTVGTTQTVKFLVQDEHGVPLPGIQLTPLVISEPEGTLQHLEIFPSTAMTDASGYVTFNVHLGDRPGEYEILLFQNTGNAGGLGYTKIRFLVQNDNWATLLVLSLLGGLAIFLYGLRLASDGLQALVHDKLRQNLGEWTNNPFKGMLVGFAITTLTQSSGATTALIMTLVRTGVLSFANSVGMILGAAISGTLTVQLISLNLFAYALPAIAVGFALYFQAKNKRMRSIGLAIMGFGFVFFGMKIMTDQMAPLKNFPFFTGAVKALSDHPVWAVILSFLFTAAAQSSGATVGIVLSLTRQELLTLQEAVPMFFGAAIGASVTGLAAAVGAPPEAKRVALAHLIYKIAGTIVFLPLIAPLASAGLWVTKHLMFNPQAAPPADVMARAVANTYTLFMIITALMTIPATPWLEKLCLWLVPESKAVAGQVAKYLVLSSTDSPTVILGAARREISRMGRFVEEMLQKIADALFKGDEDAIGFIRERDKKVDFLNVEITKHLIAVTRREIGHQEIVEATNLMFIVSDLESIGDIIDKNLVPLALKMLRSESAHFSEEGRQELESLHLAVSERLSQAIIALTVKETSLAKSVIAGFQALQKEGKLLHYNHLARLRRNVLESFETSSVHLDVINYLLRIDYLVFDICLHIEGKGLPEELYASKA